MIEELNSVIRKVYSKNDQDNDHETLFDAINFNYSQGLLSNATSPDWDQFLKFLQTSLPDCSLLKSQTSFPNRSFMIVVSDSSYNNVRERVVFNFIKSLLGDYYTAYFQSTFFMERFSEVGRVPMVFFNYGNENCSEREMKLLELVKSSARQYFPEDKFVPHHLVMNNSVLGVNKPRFYKMTPDKELTMFNYLFATDSLERVKILH